MRQLGYALCLVVLALGCNERQRRVDTTTTTAATIEPVSHEPATEESAVKASALTTIEGTAEPEAARAVKTAALEPADRATVTPPEAREETWTPDVMPPPEQRLP
jgi:hypothetical protein